MTIPRVCRVMGAAYHGGREGHEGRFGGECHPYQTAFRSAVLHTREEEKNHRSAAVATAELHAGHSRNRYDETPPSDVLGGASEFLERETGFEPATLSLGS